MRTVRSLISGWLLAVAAVVVGAVPASADEGVVDLPVSFAVTNQNRTLAACLADGKTYTVRGHITGPARLVTAPTTVGTLYLHGLELGEWFWRVPEAGYNHAREMALQGHVSVTIDRLGYGASDHPAGLSSCVGSQADVAHQIVQQLRAGTYQSSQRPRFSRVALAGHSLGGATAQVEAYSFGDVDAVAILSYADSALTPAAVLTSLTWGPKCVFGGQLSTRNAPGYAYFTVDQAGYVANFLAEAPEAVLAYGAARRSLNPCGDLLSAVATAAVSAISANRITVPVLLLMGDRDLVFDHTRLALQKPLYGGPVTTQVIAGATHGLTVDAGAPRFRNALHNWLAGAGF